MTGRALAALGWVMLVSACATVALAPRDPRPFDLLGRALVAYESETGRQAITANLRWEHGADRDEIWLMTPTGQTLAHIVDTSEGAVLTRADQQQFRATSTEALTRQALGWALPLSRLQYWVRGAPAPGDAPAAVERNAANRLTAFQQHGWRVGLIYQDDGGERAGLVRRIDLTDRANEIRFVIDTWRDTGRP